MLIALMFAILLALILLNVPIAVALAVAGVMGLLVTEGTGSLVTVALDMYDGATKFSLIAIPMFVLAGAIMNASGITERLINFVSALIGFVRGGLAMVNVGVSLFFAEISGSAVADVAAMGSIMIPEMKKRGYSKDFAAAITSSSASLAIIIPPSIPMILYAVSARHLGRAVVRRRRRAGADRRGGADGRRLHASPGATTCRSRKRSTAALRRPSSRRCRPSRCR